MIDALDTAHAPTDAGSLYLDLSATVSTNTLFRAEPDASSAEEIGFLIEKYSVEAKAHDTQIMRDKYKHFAVYLDHVKTNFAAFGLLDAQVRFLKGWFKDTLPTAPIGRLAVMRLDGDYCESTMDGLTALYDKLSPGGYAIIDDYGEDQWTYCRRAVDDFRNARGITAEMIRVDAKCYYWRKPETD